MVSNVQELTVKLRRPHEQQQSFIDSPAKRKIIRAGRRSGKTTGIAILALKAFLDGRRVLYAAPTQDQVGTFWREIKRSLWDAVDIGVYSKNESLHIIEPKDRPDSTQRLRAKTAWNADTLRGDHADLLILDEWQLMDEDAWEFVGQPMLIDNNGDAVFIYTPPSLVSKSVSKAKDPRHAAKMYTSAMEDTTGIWEAFHFTSGDNPHLSAEGLSIATAGMTSLAYRQEILAEDVDEVPGAIWKYQTIEDCRVNAAPDDMDRVVVGVDPPGGATECGIVVVGRSGNHLYVLGDYSVRTSPEGWANAVINAYLAHKADRIYGEKNYGGDMVESTLKTVAASNGIVVPYSAVQATRGKAVRAEPIAARYENGEVHHVGRLNDLEEEMVSWVSGQSPHSPNRMDALVWACTALMRSGATLQVW